MRGAGLLEFTDDLFGGFWREFPGNVALPNLAKLRYPDFFIVNFYKAFLLEFLKLLWENLLGVSRISP